MKQNYLNAVYSKLVLEMDFAPLQTEGGALTVGPELKLLVREVRQRGQIVEIIDGDAFASDFLKERLEYSYTPQDGGALPGPRVSRQVYIIVFAADIPAAILGMIQTAPQLSTMPERYVLAVNLAARQVTVYGWKPGVYGEAGLLKNIFREDLESYADLPDYGELLARKRQEYTIEIQTNRSTVTYLLIGVNVAVWLFLFIISLYYHESYNQLLNVLGAKINARIIAGEYWRLLTPMFLHASDPTHVLVNCYSLYVLGNVMEKIYGHWKFTVIYFGAGVLGNIASFAFSPGDAVGASGAIFGLFGALLYFGVEQPKQFRKYFKSGVILTIILNGFLWMFIPILDNNAHLGGLAGGFLAAGACGGMKQEREAGPLRWTMLLLIILLAAVGLYLGFAKIFV